MTCPTPGVEYQTTVTTGSGHLAIEVRVKPPARPQYQRDWLFNYPQQYADQLRDAIHDAIEPIIARMMRFPHAAPVPQSGALPSREAIARVIYEAFGDIRGSRDIRDIIAVRIDQATDAILALTHMEEPNRG